MKKTIVAIAVLATLGFGGLQAASARGPHHGAGPGDHWCQKANLSDADREARDKFIQDTVDLRKEIAVTRIELRALLANEPVDVERAKALEAKLFDLKEQLRAKADAAGLEGWGGGMMKGPGHMGGHGMMGRFCDNCPNRPAPEPPAAE